MPLDARTPHYRFDPNLGDPRDEYRPVDFHTTREGLPEIRAVFVAEVSGETIISTFRGHQARQWRATPGTPCLVLGHWSDGTVHLKWRGLDGGYTIDGRFPAWVVAEDSQQPDPHVLRANRPAERRRQRLDPLLIMLLLALLVSAVLVWQNLARTLF
jgi:hypothetical protein